MKDEEIKKPISRTELTPYSRGFADGEEFGVSKAKSQTIQQVRDVLETKLNYWNNLLKNKSNHSLSDEIDIQQMRAKVEIIEELLSQLDDVSLNNNPNINLGDTSSKQSLGESHNLVNTNRQVEGNETTSVSLSPQLGCGKDTEYYIGCDCNDNEIYLKCGEFSLTTGEIVYCPSCQRKKKETSNICKNCGKTKEEHLNDFCLEEYKPKMFQPSETKLSEDKDGNR